MQKILMATHAFSNITLRLNALMYGLLLLSVDPVTRHSNTFVQNLTRLGKFPLRIAEDIDTEN